MGAVSSEKIIETALKVWKTLTLSSEFFYSKNKFQGSAVVDLLATTIHRIDFMTNGSSNALKLYV